jgi:elongation factor P
MLVARDVREGQVLRLDGDLYRVVSVTVHSGTAQLSGAVRATVRNLRTGTVTELRWPLDTRLEDVPLERVELQFLYADPEEIVLMHPETFEQFTVPRAALERYLPFLKEGASVQAWLYEGRPVDLDMPKQVPLVVASCGAGIRGRAEHTMKEAVLENGMTVMVPQFIQPGDTILVDVETGEYIERLWRT